MYESVYNEMIDKKHKRKASIIEKWIKIIGRVGENIIFQIRICWEFAKNVINVSGVVSDDIYVKYLPIHFHIVYFNSLNNLIQPTENRIFYFGCKFINCNFAKILFLYL